MVPRTKRGEVNAARVDLCVGANRRSCRRAALWARSFNFDAATVVPALGTAAAPGRSGGDDVRSPRLCNKWKDQNDRDPERDVQERHHAAVAPGERPLHWRAG